MHRQNVRMAHAENKQHLDGPSPHSAHYSQPLDDLLHRHPPQLRERRDSAFDGVAREIVDGLRLGFREAGRAQLAVRHGPHRLRGGEAVLREQIQDAAEDGRCGLAGQLLVDDGPGERREGPVGAGGSGQRERSDMLDMAAENGVSAAQLGQDVREVDRLDAGLGPQTRYGHGRRRIISSASAASLGRCRRALSLQDDRKDGRRLTRPMGGAATSAGLCRESAVSAKTGALDCRACRETSR